MLEPCASSECKHRLKFVRKYYGTQCYYNICIFPPPSMMCIWIHPCFWVGAVKWYFYGVRPCVHMQVNTVSFNDRDRLVQQLWVELWPGPAGLVLLLWAGLTGSSARLQSVSWLPEDLWRHLKKLKFAPSLWSRGLRRTVSDWWLFSVWLNRHCLFSKSFSYENAVILLGLVTKLGYNREINTH